MKKEKLSLTERMRFFYWNLLPLRFFTSLEEYLNGFFYSKGKRKEEFANCMMEEVKLLFPELYLPPHEIALVCASYVILCKHTKEQNTYTVEHLCNDTDFQTFVSKQKSAPFEKQTSNTTETISDEIPELDVVEIEKSLITIQQKVYPPLFEAKEIDLIVRYFREAA